MAKIVIVAPSDVDVDDAVKLLKGAGHDVDVEEPTPKSLLHIVLGLMGPNAYGFGPGYAYTPGDQAVDGDAPQPDGEVTTDPGNGADDFDFSADAGGGDDFNFESLGEVTVDGELIEAVRIKGPTSKLVAAGLSKGAKTSYNLNESTFSFWPANVDAPVQRFEIVRNRHTTSIELVVEGADKAQLQVGDDLISMFEAPKK